MAAPVYLESMRSLPGTAVFANRSEYDRWTNLVKLWKRDNPSVKDGDMRMLIVEQILFLHVLQQRLIDRRSFWDGSKSTHQNAGKDHEFTMGEDDAKRKDSEFWKHYPEIHKMKVDLLKLALANNVNLNLTGEVGSIHNLFGAMDETDRKKVAAFRLNGNGNETATEDIE